MRPLLLLLLSLLVGGCSPPGPEAMLRDYATRVGNAIEQDVELTLTLELPAYPPRRQRLLPVREVREGLLEVLDLRRCGLLELIGERNSSLGVQALPSQRLLYETRFLPPLNACLNRLRDEQPGDPDSRELLARLEQIARIKRTNYPHVLANALFNADHISQHFARGGQPATAEQLEQVGQLLPHLQRFAQLARLSARPDWQAPDWIDDLEQSYEAFYRSDFGRRWLPALVLLTQTLEQTAAAIEARLARRPLCFNRRPTPQAQIVRNVFQRYYAGALQPWMSAVHRSGERWRSHWQPLLDTLPATEATRRYFNRLFAEHPDSLWQRYQQARQRHTRAWQRLLDQCGMLPGRG